MSDSHEYPTVEAWYQAMFGDYHFELNGTTGDRIQLIPASDGEIGVRAFDGVEQATVCYLRPEEARALAHELLRLAELV